MTNNIETKKINKKDIFWAAIKPIKKTVSINEMIKEQQYKPIKKEGFYKKIASLKIKEPLKELLGKLTK